MSAPSAPGQPPVPTLSLRRPPARQETEAAARGDEEPSCPRLERDSQIATRDRDPTPAAAPAVPIASVHVPDTPPHAPERPRQAASPRRADQPEAASAPKSAPDARETVAALRAAIKAGDDARVQELLPVLAASPLVLNRQASRDNTPRTSPARAAFPAGLLRAPSSAEYARHYNGRPTLLMLAALHHSGAALQLLQSGADVHVADDAGRTALMYAAAAGNAKGARLLLRGGADVHAADSSGLTALHYASLRGRAGLTELLLEFGADVAAASARGQTALHCACSSEQLALELVAAAATPLDDEDEFFAEAGGDADDSATIVRRRSDRAAASTVRSLVPAASAEVLNVADEDQQTALMLAAAAGHVRACAELVRGGADVELRGLAGQRAVHLAARQGHEGVVVFLAQHGADLDAQTDGGATALHLASSAGAAGGVESTIETLLSLGASPAVADAAGRTPLHALCAVTNHVARGDALLPAARQLCDGGVDVNARDRSGETALHIAFQRARLPLAKMLVSRGAVMEENLQNQTPEEFIEFSALRPADQAVFGEIATISSANRVVTALRYAHLFDELSRQSLQRAEYAALAARFTKIATGMLTGGVTRVAAMLEQTDEAEPECAVAVALKSRNAQFIAHELVSATLDRWWGRPAETPANMAADLWQLPMLNLWVRHNRAFVLMPLGLFVIHAASFLTALALFTGLLIAHRPVDAPLHPAELVLGLYVVGFVRGELAELRSVGGRRYWSEGWNWLDTAITLLSLAAISGRLGAAELPYELSMSLLALLAWVRALFVFTIHPLVGPFLRVLPTMGQDVKNFGMLYSCAFVGSMLAFSFMFDDGDGGVLELYSAFYGEFSLADAGALRAAFLVVTVFANLLLSNLLIAQLSETYARMQEHSHREHAAARAQTIWKFDSAVAALPPPLNLVVDAVVWAYGRGRPVEPEPGAWTCAHCLEGNTPRSVWRMGKTLCEHCKRAKRALSPAAARRARAGLAVSRALLWYPSCALLLPVVWLRERLESRRKTSAELLRETVGVRRWRASGSRPALRRAAGSRALLSDNGRRRSINLKVKTDFGSTSAHRQVLVEGAAALDRAGSGVDSGSPGSGAAIEAQARQLDALQRAQTAQARALRELSENVGRLVGCGSSGGGSGSSGGGSGSGAGTAAGRKLPPLGPRR